MTKPRLFRLIVDTLTAVMGAMGAIFCVVTAFDLSVQPALLAAVSLCFSLIFTSCFLWKKALWTLLPLGALLLLAAVYGRMNDTLGPAFTQLIHDILTRFSSAYPNFSFMIPPEPAGYVSRDYTMLFAVAAVVLSAWMAWGVGYRSCLIVVAGTLPFLLLCVVINDTPPHAGPLVLLLTVWVTVLLSRLRPEEPDHIAALRLLMTMLAVALLVGAVGAVYPKDDTRDQALPEPVQDLLDRLPGPMQNMLSRDSKGFQNQDLGADVSETLDLTTQGTRERKDTVMLQISSTETGILYLRGAARDIYTGRSWESRNEATPAQSVYAHTSIGTAFGGSYQAAVQVANLRDAADVAFTPYGFISCAGAEDIVSDLRVPCFQDDYIIYYWPGVSTLDLMIAPYAYANPNPDYDQYVLDACLSLPDNTRDALYQLALAHGYDPSLDTLETIAWTAEFVRSNGSYRLNVPRQPTNFDFSIYFLENSRAGYCVHFATATATMLRALGVPSRYASGYRATVSEAGAVVDVTDKDTHAWAEAYMPGLGWIPIESTPGFGTSVTLPDVDHAPAPVEEQEETDSPGQQEQTVGQPERPEPSDAPATPSPSPEAAPSPSREPDASESMGPPAQSGGGHGLYLLLLPLALALAAVAMVLRRSVLRRNRAAAFRTENPNQAMIAQWAYLEQLIPWGAEIPDGMEQLALKAKFSQHTIAPEELRGFTLVVRKVYLETVRHMSRWQLLKFKWLSCLDL